MVRLSLTLSTVTNDRLVKLAEEAGTSKSNILRYGIVLLKLMHDAQAQGKHFGVASTGDHLEQEVVW